MSTLEKSFCCVVNATVTIVVSCVYLPSISASSTVCEVLLLAFNGGNSSISYTLSSLLRSCGPITGTTCVLVMLVLVFKEVNIEAGRFVVTLFHSQLQWSKRSAWGQYQTILKRNKQYSQVTPSNTNNTNNTKQQHPRCQKSQQKSYLYWQMPPSSVH